MIPLMKGTTTIMGIGLLFFLMQMIPLTKGTTTILEFSNKIFQMQMIPLIKGTSTNKAENRYSHAMHLLPP